MNYVEATRKQVEPLLRATFPEYRGRKIKVRPSENVTLSNLNWDSGCRSQYRTCTLAGDYIGGADKYAAQAPWANQAEGKQLPIPQGSVVVELVWSGQRQYVYIHMHPQDMPKLLTAA